MIECFHCEGTNPEFIEILNKFMRRRGISEPPNFNIAEETPSGPGVKDNGNFEIESAMRGNVNVIDPIL